MPEIRRRTWSFFLLAAPDSRDKARLFEALITQQQLQKQLCTVLKVVSGVFAGCVICLAKCIAAAYEESCTPVHAVTIGVGFFRSLARGGEKRILIARLNLNIASRDIL